METTKKKTKLGPYIFYYIGLLVLTIALSFLVNMFLDWYLTKKAFDDVRNLIIEVTEYDDEYIYIGEDDSPVENYRFKDVWEKNHDFVGWITVPGTMIDYPVMQTKDNEQYYLHRNFWKNYDYEGVPFCSALSDVKKPSDNVLIYGHNMRYGSMFHDLEKYYTESFYKEHKYFNFDTIYRDGTYEIIGVVKTDVYPSSYQYYNVANCTKKEFDDYLDFIKNKSIYKTDIVDDVQYGDKLVTLSTCAYHNAKGRLLVIGKLIDTNDKNLRY